MDEFRRLPDEFGSRRDENNSHRHLSPSKTKDKNIERKKLRKATQLLCASAATAVLVTASLPSAYFNRFLLYLDAVFDSWTETVQLADIRPDNYGALVAVEPIRSSESFIIEFDYFIGNEENRSNEKLEEGILVSFEKEPVDISDNPNHVYYSLNKEERYRGCFGLDIAICGDMHSDKDHLAIVGEDVTEVLDLKNMENLENGVHHVKLSYRPNTLMIEHDGIMSLFAADLHLEKDEPLYLVFSAATASSLTTSLMHNILINGEPVRIENDTHNSDGSICIFLSWDTGNVSHPFENENAEETDSTNADASLVKSPVIIETETVCENCMGHGFICPGDPRADDLEGCHGEMYVSCKACNQTGYQNGELCSWCKGTLTHLCPSFESHYTCEACQGSGIIKTAAGY